VQSSSLRSSWALILQNALLGRRLLFASACFFAGAVSSITASATPAQSGLRSLGDAELLAASCQEFINYKNSSSACALCQHAVSRSLMACVYATADSAGVCCALQGDKEMSAYSRVRSSTAYVKTACFRHAREGPTLWGHFAGVMPHVPDVVAWTDQQSWGIHLMSQRQLTNMLLLRSVKTETTLSRAARVVCLHFMDSEW